MKTRFYFTSADNAKQAESIMYYALAEAQIGAMALTWVSDDDDMSVDVKIDDPRWKKATDDEFAALIQNGTWELVPPEPTQNLVGNKWVFRIKRNPDGSVERLKARLISC